jgi:hypothetical protein
MVSVIGFSITAIMDDSEENAMSKTAGAYTLSIRKRLVRP